MNTIYYKYKSLNKSQKPNSKSNYENTISSLKDKYFFFSRPSQLNDKYEFHVRLTNPSGDLIWNNIIEKQKTIKNFPSPLLDKNNPNYKEMAISFYRSNYFKPKTKHYYQLFKGLKNEKEKFHVLSLTKNFKNKKMWESYADYYSGILIGYNAFKYGNFDFIEITENNELAENYSELYFVDNKPCFQLTEIKYTKKNIPKISLLNIDGTKLEYFLTHKRPRWKNEQEYRGLFRYNKDCNDYNKNLIIHYPKHVLNNITFGKNVSPEDKEEIIKLIKDEYGDSVLFYTLDENWNQVKI